MPHGFVTMLDYMVVDATARLAPDFYPLVCRSKFAEPVISVQMIGLVAST